jgi:hypothetical protein
VPNSLQTIVAVGQYFDVLDLRDAEGEADMHVAGEPKSVGDAGFIAT